MISKKQFLVLPPSLLLLSIILSLPCHGELICTGPLSDTVAYPAQWFLFLVVLSLFALSLSDQKHKFWLKFTGIFFLVGMFFVLISPETARGIMLNPDKELTNWFFLGVYTVTSLVYFITQFVKNRR